MTEAKTAEELLNEIITVDDAIRNGYISNDNLKPITEKDLIPTAVIKIKYLPGAARMEMTEVGDWCDMYTYKETVLKKGERTYINLGFACQLPSGCEAIMAPRSSTYKRWGILQTNSIGK